MLQFRAALFRRRARRGEVNRAIFRGDPASHCQHRSYPCREFRRDDPERAALALDQFCGSALAVERICAGLLKGSFAEERRRYPYARCPGSLQSASECFGYATMVLMFCSGDST